MLFDLASHPARNLTISRAILPSTFSTTARLLLVQVQREIVIDKQLCK
jgi:hypothetical protein